jgi:hypothetical protein
MRNLRTGLFAVALVCAGLSATTPTVRLDAQGTIVAGVTPSAWRSLGPANVAGSIAALSIDPRDGRVMLAVSANGGLWRSVDRGASWFPVDQLFAQLQPGWHEGAVFPPFHAAIARDPRDPNNIVASIGWSLARSVDGGSTWTMLPPPGTEVTWLAWGRDGTLWRGASLGAMSRSNDNGATFHVVEGFGSTGIAVHPSQPGLAIATGPGRLYLTSDAGATWRTLSLTVNQSLTGVAYAPGHPSNVYAVSDGKLFRSADGGATFAALPNSTYFNASPIWIDPVNPGHVVLTARADVTPGVSETRAFETNDAGQSFRSVRVPLALEQGPYQLVEEPGFNGTTKTGLYASTALGVFRIEVTALDSWLPLNNGLATAEVVGIDGSAATGTMIAMTQHAGTLRSATATADRLWRAVAASTPSFVYSIGRQAVVLDQSNPDFVYVADGTIRRSSDGGNSFSDSIGFGYLAALRPDDPNVLVDAGFDAPSTPGTAILTVLRRSTNARAMTPSFATIYSLLSTSGNVRPSFRDFAFAPSRPRTAWASLSRSFVGAELLRSDDMDAATPTWTTVTFPGSASSLHLAIDPSDPQTVYVAKPASAADGLYRTRDGGATWTDLSGPTAAAAAREIPGELPPLQAVYDVAIHPDKRTWLYAATEAGVYASENDGSSWTFVGPTRAPVRDLFWMNRTLVAATYGRGVYSVDLTSASNTLPAVSADRAALSFAATSNGSTFVNQTPAQTVRLTQTGGGSVTWTAHADQPWLTVTPASGSGSGALTIGVTPSGGVPPNGASTGSVTITVGGAGNPLAPIAVTLTVMSLGTSAAPVGALDIPSAGSTLQGSVAVAGWALDDIAIDRVEIWRDLVAGETTPPFASTPDDPRAGKVFIANGTFVDGARPDVEAVFPSTPFRHRAGWGYLLLTWGLPNQGNGTYTFHAYAFDTESRVSLIGSRTVTGANATATRPFGSIDTPAMGAVVSGTVVNFGWALTPKVTSGPACTIPASGVQVSIDSGPLQPVVYGSVRPDVAAGFTDFTNSAAAGGHYILDTTTLANGLHTIGWLVTDSCGRADGVGSRFFTVANSSSVAAAQTARLTTFAAAAGVEKPRPASERDFSGAGTRVVRVAPNERVEITLPGDEPYRAASLPIGSSFDAATNTFMWQPAAGFLGAYDLQFLPAEAGSHNSAVTLRVVVGPPARMVIDTPRAGNVLASSGFTVAGWAVDLGSTDGAGIDTLHVWAHPVDGKRPVFVGVAKPGGSRRDVAKLYGGSFGDAGFTLTGTLAPGTYDLVVYAHSRGTNAFEGAETVRVVVK